MDMAGVGGREGEGGTNGESSTETYTTICKTGSQWEFAVPLLFVLLIIDCLICRVEW